MHPHGWQMTEFCRFRVGEWVFILLNEYPMTIICYHTAPSPIDHLEWSGHQIPPCLKRQHLPQINRGGDSAEIMYHMYWLFMSKTLCLNCKVGDILPLYKNTHKTEHWSWELLEYMINNRSVRSLESRQVVPEVCLANMPWGLEAAMSVCGQQVRCIWHFIVWLFDRLQTLSVFF